MNKKVVSPRVTLVDTGENTMTGGRLKRVARYIENEEAFASHTETVLVMSTLPNPSIFIDTMANWLLSLQLNLLGVTVLLKAIVTMKLSALWKSRVVMVAQ